MGPGKAQAREKRLRLLARYNRFQVAETHMCENRPALPTAKSSAWWRRNGEACLKRRKLVGRPLRRRVQMGSLLRREGVRVPIVGSGGPWIKFVQKRARLAGCNSLVVYVRMHRIAGMVPVCTRACMHAYILMRTSCTHACASSAHTNGPADSWTHTACVHILVAGAKPRLPHCSSAAYRRGQELHGLSPFARPRAPGLYMAILCRGE